MSTALDCITLGGATRDTLFFTREGSLVNNSRDPLRQVLVGFEYGAKILASSCLFALGGGGANVAVGAARLGLRAAAFLSVGSDQDGSATIGNLRHENVATFGVTKHPALRTGFTFVVVTGFGKDHVAFLYRGANDALAVRRTDLERRTTRWIYLSSLGEQAWKRISPVLLGVVRNRPVKLAWNPGERQLALGYTKLRPLLKKTDVLLLNKDEATELILSSGVRLRPALRRLPALLKGVQRFGPQLVVITDGKKGAAVYNGHRGHALPALRSKVVDTTGAGDAFGAGFIAGLRQLHDLEPALRLALKNSAAACSVPGAQGGLLRWREVARGIDHPQP
ncbi:MAG: carbohydrate kinase family protein [bacterium]